MADRRQNDQITKTTARYHAMQAREDRENQRRVTRWAREAVRHEKQLTSLAATVVAMRRVIGDSGYARATELTGYSEAQLRAIWAATSNRGEGNGNQH